MKKFKKITSLLLCVLLAMTLLGSTFVSAARKPITLDVRFNGHTVRLITDADKRDATASLKSTRKAWGKHSKYENGIYWHRYTYKRGKSTIEISDNDVKKDRIGGISLKVYDKNVAVAGIKVGNSRTYVLKTLKKIYGSKAVHNSRNTITVDFGPYMPISFKMKNDHVYSISWFRS